MLNIYCRDYGNARVQDLQNILITFSVFGTGHVCVGEFIDNCDSGIARNNSLDVHLFKCDTAILNFAQGYSFQIADKHARVFSSMRLNNCNDNIDALAFEEVSVFKHLKCLPNSWCGPDVDP